MDDLPPIATDDELVEWARQLTARPTRPNRPLYATRTSPSASASAPAETTPMMSTEELLLDISERAAAACGRRRIRVTVRR